MAEPGFALPPAPASQSGAVKAWSEPVTIPTYAALPADRNPMFLERRVYQGSSGAVYPLPFIDRVATEKSDRAWAAAHIENEFLRVMVLPELGGRIHVGLDKSSGYDFFYRQNVIKPALVGLAGPWASGGVEFNWPQHHRPATYMPVEVEIERHPDGSCTLWCGDHDPLQRLKGMHGVCLHPGKAYLELKARLYNRTPLVQTFLWWANAAVRAHEQYQSFFPPDVRVVADHAKRALSAYPLCEGEYYGVDYGRRGRLGVPPGARPPRFQPTGAYPANDLRWYANIPVPTSYMALGSRQDFVGGYDHAARAGVVHIANHHIAPGKKQWTWGNHEFGYAWDRNLSDDAAPYMEIMAGVYSDNQPDFSFLAPGETRTFSQFWYPIQRVGPPQAANLAAAVSLALANRQARIGVAVSAPERGARVRLSCRGRELAQWRADLAPAAPLLRELQVPARTRDSDLCLVVQAAGGRELIRYQPAPPPRPAAPAPALAPPPPPRIASQDALFFTGLHLEQYRHATRSPQPYWREALRRDPGDTRCNNALGLYHLRRGEFAAAAEFFQTAIASQTRRNPNPPDGEAHYNLGLALRHLGRDEDAYAAFYKATWNYAPQAAAFYELARIDAARGHWPLALEHVLRCLRGNQDHLQARNLGTLALRALERNAEADAWLIETRALDPLDAWARHLAGHGAAAWSDNRMRLDVALDYAGAGQFRAAAELIEGADAAAGDGSAPMAAYARGYCAARAGDAAGSAAACRAASAAPPAYCFPHRVEEIAILAAAMRTDPADPRAPYYLGNLFYHCRRHAEAVALWRRAAKLDAGFPTVWRNLGIAYFNLHADGPRARRAFDRALRADPGDARVLYERDQLWKRLGESPARRLAELEKFPALAAARDDLAVELATLYNHAGRHRDALSWLAARIFQPWEGGEGLALGQYVRAHLALARRALRDGDAAAAKSFAEAALRPPPNLGEARHPLANCGDILFLLGQACLALGDRSAARAHWREAAGRAGDFVAMRARPYSELTWWAALAEQALGRRASAERRLGGLAGHAAALAKAPAEIDYFATSLPAMLLFNDDPRRRQAVVSLVMRAQVALAAADAAAARRLLRRALRLDPGHDAALDLFAELDAHAPFSRQAAAPARRRRQIHA